MGDELIDLLGVMTELHPDLAPAAWPPGDMDKLIEDCRTVAYRSFKGADPFAWLVASNFALALSGARLWRKMRGAYQ